MNRSVLAVALGALALSAAASDDKAGKDARKDPPPDAVRQLRAALEQAVAAPALKGSRIGIAVASVETGRILWSHAPDELLNPASNVKLVTAGAALARLGSEYRFDTEFLADAPPKGGTVKVLYVRGKGDPTMVTERLWAVAGELLHRGLRTVRGDLVVDDGFFDGEREGPGWDQERGDRAYLAPTGAVSLNFNTVAIHVAPGERVGDRGRVAVEPASDFVQIENRTRTVRPGALRRVVPSSAEDRGRQRVAVEGRLPLGSREQTIWRRVDDPAAYFGHTLKRLLELRGVKVAGRVRRGEVPPGAALIHVAESEELGEIVRRLNKTSNNFMAEQILKTLGAEVKGPPGTWAKGIEAAEDFLVDVGVPRGSYVMKNGSGLNDTNRFSARQVVRLLREMWRRFPLMAEFVASLPVAGKDGTIRWRMEGTEAVGRLRAKTGTLEGVTSLSGYVETASRHRLVFAVLVNDFPGRAAPAVRAVDAVGEALAAAGGVPASPGVADVGAGPAAGPTPGRDSVADPRALVANHYRLGRAGDRRNLPLLRAALRTEHDPAVRMAAAEAIYLSDPDSDAARRTFLESLDPAALGPLRALAAPDPTGPVLGSLADLAAEGDLDALSRLVEISPAAAGDPGLWELLSSLWEEVGRGVPEQAMAALRSSAPAASDAALAAMARGIAHASEPEHPFVAAARGAALASDPAAAAFGSALARQLDERIAAARSMQAAPPAIMGPGKPAAPGTGAGG